MILLTNLVITERIHYLLQPVLSSLHHACPDILESVIRFAQSVLLSNNKSCVVTIYAQITHCLCLHFHLRFMLNSMY